MITSNAYFDIFISIQCVLNELGVPHLIGDEDLVQNCMLRAWEQSMSIDQMDGHSLLQVSRHAVKATLEGERVYYERRVLWHDLPGVDHLLR